MSRSEYKTEQEVFWSSQFGDEYISRNRGQLKVASDLAFFSRILGKANRIQSCIEFGANIGLNLQALKLLFPEQEQYAVEINSNAVNELRKFCPESNIYEGSILDFDISKIKTQVDLSLIKGVLIHINPDYLTEIYTRLYEVSKRYILICEYYNPTPVSVKYRGHSDRLFKRDFAGELLDMYPSLELLDYGFIYHRDNNFPQDDITWFLMQKS